MPTSCRLSLVWFRILDCLIKVKEPNKLFLPWASLKQFSLHLEVQVGNLLRVCITINMQDSKSNNLIRIFVRSYMKYRTGPRIQFAVCLLSVCLSLEISRALIGRTQKMLSCDWLQCFGDDQ